ncbi:YoaK family protein [Salinactinospora qingdaonensis]|uniref:YoaK family protein n=1 Tax=Salinactinospora qingdaonensis TaxID=702744 RepID=A0ABP7G0A9_9ACTN
MIVVLLSLAAGMTDALCLLHLGGVFASVVTGNLVLVAVSTVHGVADPAARAAISTGAYAAGVFAGSRMVARRSPAARPPTCLALETLVLGLFVAGWLGDPHRSNGEGHPALLLAAGAAMGLQGIVVRTLGRPGLSTTYLTGALTRIVSTIGDPSWLRRLDWLQLLALGCLVLGAAVEAVLMRYLPWTGPLPAAVLATAALLIAYRQ